MLLDLELILINVIQREPRLSFITGYTFGDKNPHQIIWGWISLQTNLRLIKLAKNIKIIPHCQLRDKDKSRPSHLTILIDGKPINISLSLGNSASISFVPAFSVAMSVSVGRQRRFNRWSNYSSISHLSLSSSS